MTRPSEARDDAAVKAILGELPEDHPAREAYAAGVNPTRLMSLVEREDLVEKLSQAWLDWYTRRLLQQRSAHEA